MREIGEDLHSRDSAPVFLLYGPPGTGKSTLVEYIAKEKDWDLVRLSPSDFIVNGMENIEYKAREIFSDLCTLEKCVILLDEMDSLLKNRTSEGIVGTVMEYVVPAFLPKLQELHDYAKRSHLSVFFVTNFLEKMDPAIKRPGRIDHSLIVLPYTAKAKNELAKKIIERKISKIKENEKVVKECELTEFVLKEIEQLPNYMVYRDIEKAVNIACKLYLENTESNPNCYSKIFQATAIDVYTYDYELRKGAEFEFAQFLLRLANIEDKTFIEKVNDSTFTDKEETKEIFNRLKCKLDGEWLKKWKEAVDQWIEK